MSVISFLSCSAWHRIFCRLRKRLRSSSGCTVPLDLFAGALSVLLGKVLKPVSSFLPSCFTPVNFFWLLRASSGFVGLRLRLHLSSSSSFVLFVLLFCLVLLSRFRLIFLVLSLFFSILFLVWFFLGFFVFVLVLFLPLAIFPLVWHRFSCWLYWVGCLGCVVLAECGFLLN